jgi:hypothetical protein
VNEIAKSFLTAARERLRDASQLWIFYGVTVLLAYGFTMFNLLLVGDDWNALQATYASAWTVSIGRWIEPIIWYLANDNSFSPPITIAAISVAYLGFGAACCLCLDLKRRESWLIFTCMLISFPFNAEPFAFKEGHLIYSFGIGLATVSGLLVVRGYELLVSKQRVKAAIMVGGAIAAFILSAAAYQILALLGFALVLVRLAGMLGQRQAASTLLRSTVLLLGFSVIVFTTAFFLYMGTVRVASWLAGIPLLAAGPYAISNTFVESWMELRNQIYGGLELWRDLLFRSQHLMPLAPKLAFLLVTIALIFAVARPVTVSYYDQPKAPVILDALLRAAILCGVIALLFLTPLALGMVAKISNYRYNDMIGIAVPYAMVFALFFDIARDVRWRWGIAALTFATITIFVFEQNRASVTTFLLNRHDLAIANRMLDRITANSAFAPFAAKGQATIVFYGEATRIVLPRPFSADKFLMGAIDGCGVFNCQLRGVVSAFDLLSEADMTYRASVWPYVPEDISTEERQRLEQRIKETHPWPAPDAVIFGTDVIIIVLDTAHW